MWVQEADFPSSPDRAKFQDAGFPLLFMNEGGERTMTRNSKKIVLIAGMFIVLAAVLYSCGGGGYGGGGGTTAPAPFSLTSPADNATGVATTPMLTWTPSAGATGYRVQVDTTGAFAGPLVINITVGATIYSYSVQPSGMLASGTTYYWRVIAENIYGQAVAGPRSFTTS